MSNTVDERLVEMRFDNRDFEKNVQVSINTLDELNKKLKLEDAGKSFEALENAASRVDLSSLAENVQAVADRCSTLGIIGGEIIRKLTDGFMELAQGVTQAVKSLTVDQITVGFDKYERKVQSVQTIMNSTGKSIDEVSAALDKLNWFTDETSYNFSDMVDNIGKFTNAGVPLEVAITSMIGIADAAGLAGASVQDASHAMEGFSKAIAQGYVSRQNWQWIKTAHMDTIQFKQAILDSAEALGTLGQGEEKINVSIEAFEENLKDGWLTAEVLNDALAKFGGTTEDLYKIYQQFNGEMTTSDIINQMGDQFEGLGLKAFRAAQEAKTFTDAINSVKDAVSTGWMTSFEQIFGNYEEAKVFWTDVANEMWDIFASGGETRNELLSEVFKGPFDQFRASITEAGISLNQFEDSLYGVAKSANIDVDELVDQYGSLSNAFKEGAISSDMARDALKKLSSTTEEVSSNTLDEIIEKTWEIVSGARGASGEIQESLIKELKDSYKDIKGIDEAFDGLLSTINDGILDNDFSEFEKFETSLKNILSVSTSENEALKAFLGIEEKTEKSLDELVKKSKDTQMELYEASEEVSEDARIKFDDLIEDISKKSGRELITGSILNILGVIKQVQEAARAASEEVFGTTEERAAFLYSIVEKINIATEKLIMNDEALQNLKDTLTGLLSIVRFFIITGEKILGIFSPIKDLFDISGDSILNFTGNVGRSITAFVDWYDKSEAVSAVTDKLRGYIQTVVNLLKEFIPKIKELASKYLPVIKSRLDDVKNTLKKLPIDKWVKGIKNGFKSLWGYIKQINLGGLNIDISDFSGFLEIASESVINFYNSIKDFLVPYIEKAKEAFNNLGNIFQPIKEKLGDLKNHIEESGGIIGFISDKISSFRETIKEFIETGDIKKVFDGLVENFEPIKKSLDDFISEIGEKLKGIDWGSVLAFTIGLSLIPMILSISDAFNKASQLFKTGKTVLGNLNTIFTRFSNQMKTTVKQVAEAAVSFSIAIAILTASLWVLSTQIEKDDLKRGMSSLLGIMAAFALSIIAVGLAIKFLKVDSSAMLGILAFAGAIAVLTGALYVLQNVKIEESKVFTILGLMAAMGVAAVALTKLGVKLDGVGAYFLTFSGAVLVLAIALERIATIPADKINGAVDAITNLMLGLGIITLATKLVKGSSTGILGATISVILIVKLLEYIGDDKIRSLAETAKKNWDVILELLIALGAMALVSRLGGKNSASAGLGVALITASLFIMVEAIKKIAEINTKDLAKGMVVIEFVTILYSLLLGFSSIGGNNNPIKSAAAIVILTASLILVYHALKLFGSLNTKTISEGLSVLTTVFILYAGLLAVSHAAKAGPIIAMAVTMGMLVAALAILTLYDINEINAACVALCVALATLSGAMLIIGHTNISGTEIAETVILLTGIIGIGVILNELAKNDWVKLATASVSLSLCLTAVAGAMRIICGIDFSAGQVIGSLVTLAIGVLAFGVLGQILVHLSQYNWDDSVNTASSIGIALLAIAGAVRILNGVDLGSGAAASTVLALAILEMGIVIIAFGLMMEAIDQYLGVDAEKVIDRGVTLCAKIGEAIGQMVGSLFGGLEETVFSGLPKMGEDLKTFFNTLGEIKIDPEVGKALSSIGKGIGDLAVANFGANVASLFREDYFHGLDDKMAELGHALNTLSENAPQGDTMKNVNIALESLATVAELTQKLPADGGWLQRIAGSQGLGAFGEQLEAFGHALQQYGVSVSWLNHEAITKSVDSVKDVVDIADMIPVSGGLISVFTGRTDWIGLSNGLVAFGEAIVKYGDKVDDINSEAITASVEDSKHVSEIADMIPRSGGLMQFIEGNLDMATFGKGLKEFGSSLYQYGVSVSWINHSKIAESVEAGKNVAEIADMIPRSGGIMGLINGNLDMVNFSEGLSAYGTAIRDFSVIAAEIDYEAIHTWAENIADLESVGKSAGNSFIIGIESTEDAINQTIYNIMSRLNKNATSKASGFYSVGMEIASGIAKGLEANTIKISEVFETYFPNFISHVEETINKVEIAIKSKEASITATVSTLVLACANRIKSMDYEFSNAARDLSNSFINGFDADNIANNIEYSLQMCVNEIDKSYYDFYWAGYNIVGGIADGIDHGSYQAEYAVQRLCELMGDTFTEYNDINSPSRLYSKWAEYIPEGIAKGVEDGSGEAENAISGLGSDMIAAIIPALDTLARIANGEFEISPHIRPVVDMTDVYDNAERINELFGTNQNQATYKAGKISRNMSEMENAARVDNSKNSQNPVSNFSPVINNYIYTQPGQSTAEIADEVERRMVKSLNQRKVAFVNR